MHEFINVLDLLIVHELDLKFGEIRCELIFNQSVLVVIQSVAFQKCFNIKNLAAHEHRSRRVGLLVVPEEKLGEVLKVG